MANSHEMNSMTKLPGKLAISESFHPYEFFVPIFCGRARWNLTFSIYNKKYRHIDVLGVLKQPFGHKFG